MKKVLVIILSLLCLQGYAQNSNADRDYRQAEIYFKSGLYDKASKSIKDYVFDDGDKEKASAFAEKIKKCKELFNTAETLYAAKNYKEALAKYQELEKLNPSHPDLDSRMASCRNAIASASRESNKSSSTSSSAR